MGLVDVAFLPSKHLPALGLPLFRFAYQLQNRKQTFSGQVLAMCVVAEVIEGR
jgi:hypothetical protein